jgi:hypothetical protein
MPRWLPVQHKHIAIAELSVCSQSVRNRIESNRVNEVLHDVCQQRQEKPVQELPCLCSD